MESASSKVISVTVGIKGIKGYTFDKTDQHVKEKKNVFPERR